MNTQAANRNLGHRTAVMAMLLLICPAAAAQAKRVVLDNGVTLLLLPIPEANQVGIEAIYRVGFLHEPKGMTQAAHLLEHLVCNAATSGYGPNESMAALNQLGMANAETLPDWTHYDYMLPAEKLELAFKIEAERLTSLRIDSDIIKAEAPRCYMETDFVEQNPKSGMTKHAFMAFAQAWRHGLTTARVRGGLEEFSIEELVKFHRRAYRPDKLTLIVVGGFDQKKTIELARKHLGGIATPEVERPGAIEWSKIPKRTTVRWDAKVRAVCIAYAPPRARVARVTLSLWGNLLHQHLTNDADIAAVTDSLSCTTQMWNVGELPFYIYATAKPDASLDDVERVLNDSIERFTAKKPPAMVVQQIRGMANQLARQTDMLTWDYVKQSAAMVARQRGGDELLAQRMVLGQAAINWGVAHFLLGTNADRVARSVAATTADKLHALTRRYLRPKTRFITHLVPIHETE